MPRADVHGAHAGVDAPVASRLPTPRHTSARKSSPGVALLGEHLVAAVAVVADRRRRHEHARLAARGSRPRAASTAVPRTRLSRMRCFCSSVQRCSPMPSPARCTTASTPSSAGASMRPACGIPADLVAVGDAAAPQATAPGARRSAASSTSADPISPLAPLIDDVHAGNATTRSGTMHGFARAPSSIG